MALTKKWTEVSVEVSSPGAVNSNDLSASLNLYPQFEWMICWVVPTFIANGNGGTVQPVETIV